MFLVTANTDLLSLAPKRLNSYCKSLPFAVKRFVITLGCHEVFAKLTGVKYLYLAEQNFPYLVQLIKIIKSRLTIQDKLYSPHQCSVNVEIKA